MGECMQDDGVRGVRLDAVKHISPGFEKEWLDHMRKATGKVLCRRGILGRRGICRCCEIYRCHGRKDVAF